MSAIVPVANVSAVTTAIARPQADRPVPSTVHAAAVVKHVQPIRYYGGLDGMNATNLIVALQSNSVVSNGYSARAIETGGTPPPAIVDRGA